MLALLAHLVKSNRSSLIEKRYDGSSAKLRGYLADHAPSVELETSSRWARQHVHEPDNHCSPSLSLSPVRKLCSCYSTWFSGIQASLFVLLICTWLMDSTKRAAEAKLAIWNFGLTALSSSSGTWTSAMATTYNWGYCCQSIGRTTSTTTAIYPVTRHHKLC